MLTADRVSILYGNDDTVPQGDSAYPPGSFTVFDPGLNTWRVFAPPSSSPQADIVYDIAPQADAPPQESNAYSPAAPAPSVTPGPMVVSPSSPQAPSPAPAMPSYPATYPSVPVAPASSSPATAASPVPASPPRPSPPSTAAPAVIAPLFTAPVAPPATALQPRPAAPPTYPTVTTPPAPTPTTKTASIPSTLIPAVLPTTTVFTKPLALTRPTLRGPCCLGENPGLIDIQELEPTPTQPPLPVLSIEEAEARYNIRITRKAWYKYWQTWAVAGGVLALGVGTAFVIRRRRRHPR